MERSWTSGTAPSYLHCLSLLAYEGAVRFRSCAGQAYLSVHAILHVASNRVAPVSEARAQCHAFHVFPALACSLAPTAKSPVSRIRGGPHPVYPRLRLVMLAALTLPFIVLGGVLHKVVSGKPWSTSTYLIYGLLFR